MRSVIGPHEIWEWLLRAESSSFGNGSQGQPSVQRLADQPSDVHHYRIWFCQVSRLAARFGRPG
jgi:hypothetical protein